MRRGTLKRDFDDLPVRIDASLRRVLPVRTVVIAAHEDERHIEHRHEKLQISRVQIAR